MSIQKDIKLHFDSFTYHGLYVLAITNAKGEVKKSQSQPAEKEYLGKKHYMATTWNKLLGKYVSPNAIQINTENISVIDVDMPDKCPILEQLINDCNMYVKTNKGYHFYYKLCDKLLRSNTGKKSIVTHDVADINIDKLWYCPEYTHIDDGRKFHYKVVKSVHIDELKDMPDYAVMWCNMVIQIHNNKTKPKDGEQPIARVPKHKPDIIHRPTAQIQKFSLETMKNIYELLFSNNYFKDYAGWRDIGYMSRHLNNSEECFLLFDQYSKKVKGYEINPDNRKAFYGNNLYDANWNESGILSKCKKIDIEYYKKYLCNIKPEDIYGKNIIEINSKYLMPEDGSLNYIYDGWYNYYKCLMIRSSYGTGKTYAFKKIIETFKPQKILFITYRQSLAHSLTLELKEKYNFNCYLDKDVDILNSDRLILQIDSIARIMPTYNPFTNSTKWKSYDLIVLDEIEGLLNHLSFNNIKQSVVFNVLQNTIANSKKILCLDGDMSDRSYDFIDRQNMTYKIYNNTFQPIKKHFTFTHDKLFMNESIEKDLSNNKKLVLVCMSKNESEYYRQIYEKRYKVIIHNSIEKNKSLLLDVNKSWAGCDILIYSPTVESGVDFNIVNYFYKCYCFISSESTTYRALFQMLNRVRHYENNNILVYYNDADHSMALNDNSALLWTYSEIKQNKYGNDDSDNLINTLIHNDVETINSSNFFMQCTINTLLSKGHTYEFKQNKKEDDGKNKIDVKELSDFVFNAKELTDNEFHILLENQKKNIEITRDENYSIQKTIIKKLWNYKDYKTITLDNIQEHYDNFRQLKKYKHLISDKELRNDSEVLYKKQHQKTDTILKFINMLTFDINNVGKSIAKEVYDKQKEEIIKLASAKEYKALFGCKKNSRPTIDNIFKDYGLVINKTELVRKRDDNNKRLPREYVYNLNVTDAIAHFIQNSELWEETCRMSFLKQSDDEL